MATDARAWMLGIDLGGTKVAYALGEPSGRIARRHRRPTEPSGRPAEDVARMADDVRRLLGEAGLSTRDLACVGVSVPGPFDPERGLVLHPPNLSGWGDEPVGPWLERELGCPVRLENDANAAALAEWRYGAGRGRSHLVYLTMSTGVGGGLVLGGRLHRGHAAAAGEIGHVPVEWEGERCGCGLRGCLEAYVGGASWTRRLRQVSPEDSRAVALAGSRDAVRPEHVVEAARAGDPFSRSELERWSSYLARGIVQIAFTLAPEMVILGTIAVAAGEELVFAPLREQVRTHLWPVFADGLAIVPAALGEDLPYRAALAAAREAFEELD